MSILEQRRDDTNLGHETYPSGCSLDHGRYFRETESRCRYRLIIPLPLDTFELNQFPQLGDWPVLDTLFLLER